VQAHVLLVRDDHELRSLVVELTKRLPILRVSKPLAVPLDQVERRPPLRERGHEPLERPGCRVVHEHAVGGRVPGLERTVTPTTGTLAFSVAQAGCSSSRASSSVKAGSTTGPAVFRSRWQNAAASAWRG
jgi:hypothetical protein